MGDAVARGARALGVPDDGRIVLAVSGGPDSMALLHGAASAGLGWQLTVGHLDHALRDDSATDAAFVTDAAAALGLKSTVRRTDVAALARTEGRSIEDAGREARYRFLAELAGERGLVMTAHTADDAAETVLINLLRGAGLAGAAGIPARRGHVLRPLLGERRATLRAWLAGAGIAYRDDPTNADPAYLRNRVRAELLPMMESLRHGAIEALMRFGRLAAEDDELLDLIAAGELARRRSDDGAIDWRDPPARALGRRVLRLAIGEPAPALERIEALVAAAEGPRGGLRIELGRGRAASVRERRIVIQ
jgi:tRNA(Ile)-lysidine synthase